MPARTNRLLVVGVGSIGERHLRCFQHTGRIDAAIVEVNPALRQSIAERYHLQTAFADLESALSWRADAAVIATPAHLHIEQAQRLAEAGVHLLIEKPLGTTFAGLDRLQQTVRQDRLTAAVAYVYRCHPLLAQLRQTLLSGRFGSPVELIAVSGQHFPFYRPAYRQIYYTSHATGGGAIQDALTHVVNAGEWLLGPIDRLVADAAHCVLEGVDVEDTVHLLARHGQVLASYALNQHQAPNEMTLTVVCDRGTLRGDFHEHRWRWQTKPDESWHEESRQPLERDTIFVHQAHAFLDAIEGKATSLCSLEQAEQTLRVNLAALSSVQQNRWVAIHEGQA